MQVMPHQLHGDGGDHSSSLLESPGEVEQSGSERRFQHNEHGTEWAEAWGVRMRRGAGQQADALPGEFLHDPEAEITDFLERSSWGYGHSPAE